MKAADYYRYYADLMATSAVTFSSRTEMINFIAQMTNNDYLRYLNDRISWATTVEEYQDLEDRKRSETFLVSLYVRSFLITKIQDTENKFYKFKKAIFRRPLQKFVFDAWENTEMYDWVLERLKRHDTATGNVFAPRIRYTIVGDKILQREVL